MTTATTAAAPVTALQRIRPDVRAMAAYHVQPAAGLLKMDAMENPFPLPPELTQSRSGLYVQDQNELLTLEVLQHVVPDGEELPDWLARWDGWGAWEVERTGVDGPAARAGHAPVRRGRRGRTSRRRGTRTGSPASSPPVSPA